MIWFALCSAVGIVLLAFLAGWFVGKVSSRKQKDDPGDIYPLF